MKRKLAVFLAAVLCVTSLSWGAAARAEELPDKQPEPATELTAPAATAEPAGSPALEPDENRQPIPQEEIPAVLPDLEETEILGADPNVTIGSGGYLAKNDFESASGASDCLPFDYKDAEITADDAPGIQKAMKWTGGASSVTAAASFDPTYILKPKGSKPGAFAQEGPDCITVTEFDIKFENLVKTGANLELRMAYKERDSSASGTYIQRFQFTGAAKEFQYYSGGFKSFYSVESSTLQKEQTAIEDNKWYRIRINMLATDEKKEKHKVDVYMDGVQLLSNEESLSISDGKVDAYDQLIFTGLSGTYAEKDEQGNVTATLKAGCMIDNFSVYKKNINSPDMPLEKGRLLRLVRDGETKFASAVTGDTEEEYDQEKYQNMRQALDEAFGVCQNAQSQKEIDDAAKALEPIYNNFKPNGPHVQIEELGYYNPDAIVDNKNPKKEIQGLDDTSKLSVEAVIRTSPKLKQTQQVAVTSVLYQKDTNFKNGRPVQMRSSGVFTMEKDSVIPVALLFDLTPYTERQEMYVKTMVWSDYKNPQAWLVPADKAFLNGELSYGAPDPFGGEIQAKQTVEEINNIKISVMIQAEPGEEVSLSVPFAGLTAGDVVTVSAEEFQQKMLFVGQETAQEDGFAKFEFKLTGETGTHELIICRNNTGEMINQSVMFYTGPSIQSAMDAVYSAGADGTKMKQLIASQAGALGVNTPLYQLAQSENFDFGEIAKAITSRKYEQTEQAVFQSDFYRALVIAAANQLNDADQISRLLKPGSSISGAEALRLTDPVGLKGPERYNAYLKFDTERDELFAALLAQSRPYTEATLEKEMHKVILLTQVNKALNWDTLSVTLDDSSDLIKNTAYNGLSDNIKGKVCQELYRHRNVSTMKALEKAIDDAVDTVRNGGSGSSGGISGSSGGGNRGPAGGSFSGTTTDETSPLEQPTPIEQLRSSFTDIDSVPWAAESIQVLSARGVINGVEENLFAPNDTVKREEFVKMAVLLFGLLDPEAAVDFEDVRMDDWFYPYVASGASLGLVKGISETSFGSGQDLSRQDLATLVYRFGTAANVAFAEDGEYIPFDDDDQISKCARTAVELLTMSGIVKGAGGNMFLPAQSCTRAEAAKMLYEVSKLVVAQ